MPIEVLGVNELLRKEFPPTDSLIGNGLIDKGGAILISGPQKIGKSLFGTQLALCLASQRSFVGFPVGQAEYRTLILQAEVAPKRMKERFQKQVQGFRDEALARVLSASVFSSIQLDTRAGAGEILSRLLKNSHRQSFPPRSVLFQGRISAVFEGSGWGIVPECPIFRRSGTLLPGLMPLEPPQR
jgi:hypothetical protein